MKAWLALVLAVALSVSASLALGEEWNVVEGEGGGLVAKVRVAAPRLLTDRVVEETEFWVGCDSASQLYAGLLVPFSDIASGTGADNLLLRYASGGKKPVAAVSQSTRVKFPFHWGFMLDEAQISAILAGLLLADRAEAGTVPTGSDPASAAAQNSLEFSVNQDAIRLVVAYCAGERPAWIGGEWTSRETAGIELLAAAPDDKLNVYCKNAQLNATLFVDKSDLAGIDVDMVNGISISLFGSPSPALILPGSAIEIDADRYIILTSPGEVEAQQYDLYALMKKAPALEVGVTLSGPGGEKGVIAPAAITTRGANFAISKATDFCDEQVLKREHEENESREEEAASEPVIEQGSWTVYGDGEATWAATRSANAELRFICELESRTSLMRLSWEREIPPPFSDLDHVDMALLADDVILTYANTTMPLFNEYDGAVVETWMKEASGANHTISFGIAEDMEPSSFNLFELGEFTARGSTAAIKAVQDACQ